MIAYYASERMRRPFRALSVVFANAHYTLPNVKYGVMVFCTLQNKDATRTPAKNTLHTTTHTIGKAREKVLPVVVQLPKDGATATTFGRRV